MDALFWDRRLSISLLRTARAPSSDGEQARTPEVPEEGVIWCVTSLKGIAGLFRHHVKKSLWKPREASNEYGLSSFGTVAAICGFLLSGNTSVQKVGRFFVRHAAG
jgi:hypothetical protein